MTECLYYYLSIGEIVTAERVFLEKLKSLTPEVQSGELSQKSAVSIALNEVWREARQFEHSKLTKLNTGKSISKRY
ncbi:hypothetical protein LJC01_03035 [Clostridiaceae bacterium OttesenSCG-928-D20]|nr:hypothetical protein [Clostridiaceae bacterium OttesenSCG-928-D20]